MKRFFHIFLLSFFMFSSLLVSATTANAGPTNGAGKCTVCAPLTGKWADKNFEGHPINADPPYSVSQLPPDTRSTCSDDRTVDCLGKPYCIYDSIQGAPDGAETIYHVWTNPTRVEDSCKAPKDTCIDAKGCVGSDTPDETMCGRKESLCRTQADCKNGNDNKCSDYWCVNITTNKLASDDDLTIDLNYLKCRHFSTKPACPDGKDCDNPFQEAQCASDSQCPVGQFCVPDSKGIRVCMTNERGYASLACTRDSATSLDFKCRTAIGTITASPEAFVKTALGFFLGIAGGILILLLIINGYKLMVSQGDPEKIKDAREGIIAAISGLLLIIFSLSVLALITSTILDIPGF